MKHRAKEAPGQGCPCGSGEAYDACCGRFIDGNESAATAEQLMRSRYSAYVYRNVPYLLATWHLSSRPAPLELDEPVKWLGLRILRTEGGGVSEKRGLVEFVARYRVGGTPAQRLRETSRFVREGARWYYLGADGEGTGGAR